MSLVLEHLSAKPAPKLVALVLADHADADGVCWPSYKRLMMITGMENRTVRRHVKELIDSGIITKLRTGHIVKTSDGRVIPITNAYRFNTESIRKLPSLLSTRSLGIVAENGHPKVAKSGHKWRGPLSTKPSLNHHEVNHHSFESVDNSDIGLGEALSSLLDEDRGE